MKLPMLVARLCASGMLACASSALAQPIAETQFGTPKFEGKQTIGSGAVVIESTLLASSAVDAAATKIAQHVRDAGATNVLVIGGAEVLDFGQVAMIQTEMGAIRQQLTAAMTPPSRGGFRPTVALPVTAIIPALAGMLRSDTEFAAQDVSLDPRILPTAVAAKLGATATLFSAKIGANVQSTLLKSFQDLETLALAAQQMHDGLANKGKDQTEQEKRMVERLAAALKRYDSFSNRVTTANDKGVVPLAAAARLAQVINDQPLILRVNTEKAGGTTVKRTNLLTFFGADGLSISGGLVASYQLTDPEKGTVRATGVVTCRTALTKLKSVQDASWKPRGSETDDVAPQAQKAVCRSIKSEALKP